MKNPLRTLNQGLAILAFTGIVLVAPAGYHIKGIANNHYIKNFAEKYYDGRTPSISNERADEIINQGNDLMYTGLGVGAASGMAGIILLNQRRKLEGKFN
jgi:hypothetical protein